MAVDGLAKRLSLLIFAPLLLLAASVVVWSEYVPDQANLQPLVVPMEIHIVQGLTVTRGETPLTNWITREHVESALPDINRIWRQAAITWQANRIDEIDVSDLPEKDEWLRLSAAVHRLSPREAVWKKNRFLGKIGDRLSGTDTRFHIFVVPYHGWTTSGESVWGEHGKQYVFLSAWVDDVEALVGNVQRGIPLKPMNFNGRNDGFARTAAHELGHALGLLHNTCTRDCLMGGTVSSGDRLTPYQIKKARSRIDQPGPVGVLYDSLEILWLWAKWGDPR